MRCFFEGQTMGDNVVELDLALLDPSEQFVDSCPKTIASFRGMSPL
jgi:hypothetical protein